MAIAFYLDQITFSRPCAPAQAKVYIYIYMCVCVCVCACVFITPLQSLILIIHIVSCSC